MEFFKENPKGSKEHENDQIQYNVLYSKITRRYFLNVQECTINAWGGISFVMDFSPRSVDLVRVNRASKKTEKACNDFVSNNLDAIHSAYLNNGLNGVKEVVRDLFRC